MSTSLYRTLNQTSTHADVRRVKITEVNTTNSFIRAVDDYGSPYQISLDLNSPVLTIPKVGEEWQIERAGYDWRLNRHGATEKELNPLTEMEPGDKRVAAENDLHLSAKGSLRLSSDTAVVLNKAGISLENNTLSKTDGTDWLVASHNFNVQGNLQVIGNGGNWAVVPSYLYLTGTEGHISFGSDSHVWLHSNPWGLETNGSFNTGSFLRVFPSTSPASVAIGTHDGGTTSIAGFTLGDTVNLYRAAADLLATDDQLDIRRGSGGYYLSARQGTETWGRFHISDTGGTAYLTWGTGGSTAPDTNLYRSAAQTLATDGHFKLASNSGTLYFGSDTNLYRGGADILMTDDWFQTQNQITARVWGEKVVIGHDGSSRAAIIFGSLADTSLYRSAADTIKTDDRFHINIGVTDAFKVTDAFTVDGNNYRMSLGGAFSGNGNMAFFIANTNLTPSANPTGGGLIYVDGGALKYRGSSGTVTTLANA